MCVKVQQKNNALFGTQKLGRFQNYIVQYRQQTCGASCLNRFKYKTISTPTCFITFMLSCCPKIKMGNKYRSFVVITIDDYKSQIIYGATKCVRKKIWQTFGFSQAAAQILAYGIATFALACWGGMEWQATTTKVALSWQKGSMVQMPLVLRSCNEKNSEPTK